MRSRQQLLQRTVLAAVIDTNNFPLRTDALQRNDDLLKESINGLLLVKKGRNYGNQGLHVLSGDDAIVQYGFFLSAIYFTTWGSPVVSPRGMAYP